MKVATRLTIVMLAFLAPIGLAYTFITVRSTTQIFTADLKAETRIVQRALNASLTPNVQQREWDEVGDILAAIGQEDLIAAVLDENGKVRFALTDFPMTPPPLNWFAARIKADGAAEYMQTARGLNWFCRIVALGPGVGGYLLVVQDWSAFRKDRHRRTAASLIAVAVLLLVVAMAIPLVAHRYVTRPLAQLRRRVSDLEGTEGIERKLDGDEVELISEEFKRVDQELAGARGRLLEETERKLQLERRLLRADKLATIGTLATGVAHEIGTPLAVIRGRAEFLTNHPDERKVKESLQVIVDQIDRIAKMVRMLLDLGRRRESIRTSSDIRAIANRTVQLLESEAARRRVAVVADLGLEPIIVDCDPDQLQQVFVNLEVNALDAMADQGGTLRITSATDGASGRVKLCFEDTGPGVPAPIRDRIFDPFFTTKDPGKGTGMGLAVSQTIISEHDGDLALEQNSHGARFVIYLPASPVTKLKPGA
jgi:two-component system, NtrC family, sensor kinase